MSRKTPSIYLDFDAVFFFELERRYDLKHWNYFQVLVRFPTGERKERRFHSSATVKSLYDFVDSLDNMNLKNYRLVSGFPRISFGPEKYFLSLKDAGLHPQASLFVEAE